VFHGDITPEIAQGLLELDKRIAAAGIPPSKLDETITLATWNVREFGRRPRLAASLHYIAEILGQFDLIAVVEVRDNLADLEKVKEYLGPYWRVVFSDYVTDGGGNRERIAYLYDNRAVAFTGLAAEADSPRVKKGTEYVPTLTWWRAPYIASFRAGNFDFILLTAHIRWGDGETDRQPELQMLADWVAQRIKEKYVEDKDILVMGDFNIPSLDSPLYKAVTSQGLRMPQALAGLHGTNLAKDKRYDQILHYSSTPEVTFTGKGGAMDFADGGWEGLYPGSKMKPEDYTYQISDHLPLWIQVCTDVQGQRLHQIINPGKD